MEQFYQDCVEHHLNPRRNPAISVQSIFSAHNLGQDIDTVLKTRYLDILGQHILGEDCVKLCYQYIRFDTRNIMSKDESIDALILKEAMQQGEFHSHWLIALSNDIGVANALISCGLRSSFRCADDLFVKLFVGCAKYYNENVFLETLRYTGTLPRYYEHLYSEIVNQVAEYYNKVNTRCVRGEIYCSCYKQNLVIYDEYQNALYELKDPELVKYLRTKKYFPLVIVGAQDETSLDDTRASKKIKKE